MCVCMCERACVPCCYWLTPQQRCTSVTGFLLPLSAFCCSGPSFFKLLLLASCWLPCNDCNVVEGLERRLANYLLLLTLSKQRLRALRRLFSRVNGVSRHSCAFLSLNSQKRMKELSIWNNLYNLYSQLSPASRIVIATF